MHISTSSYQVQELSCGHYGYKMARVVLKTMLQQVKDNGVISEETFNLAAKLALEDR